jgi:hypothetical protein
MSRHKLSWNIIYSADTPQSVHSVYCVCVYWASGSRGSGNHAIPIATSPPRKVLPIVLPSSTTPPVSLGSLEGGSNGFHVVWTPWLVMTSQPKHCPIKSSSQAPHASRTKGSTPPPLTYATRDNSDY